MTFNENTRLLNMYILHKLIIMRKIATYIKAGHACPSKTVQLSTA